MRAGHRAALGRAITLVESAQPKHRLEAAELLEALTPHAGGAHRIGVSGPPGVGKSTTIEALGVHLLAREHKVGVLAVDPSSARIGGSIMGDKTRMPRLSQHPNAFVRPSPSGGGLGGAARATREAILVLEAAGFGVVIVESVGVGQSEAAVADMTDVFLLLAQPAAGDELQGVKKGVLELADIVAVNKADGETKIAALRAQRDLKAALSLTPPAAAWWRPPVLAYSAETGDGLAELWSAIEDHRRAADAVGAVEARRRRQRRAWMTDLVRDGLADALARDTKTADLLARLEKSVEDGSLPPAIAAERLIATFLDR